MSPTGLVWRRLLRHRLAQASLVFLAVLVVLSLAAPLIASLRHIAAMHQDVEIAERPQGQVSIGGLRKRRTLERQRRNPVLLE